MSFCQLNENAFGAGASIPTLYHTKYVLRKLFANRGWSILKVSSIDSQVVLLWKLVSATE